MNLEEAIQACWWTTDVAESKAIGTTSDPEAGDFFNGKEFPYEQFSDPNGRQGWTIIVPRWTGNPEEQIENAAYRKIVQEIERRR